ncbi:MAG: hypothetical protein AAF497_15030, partial [Planctomycetota bacterium]
MSIQSERLPQNSENRNRQKYQSAESRGDENLQVLILRIREPPFTNECLIHPIQEPVHANAT